MAATKKSGLTAKGDIVGSNGSGSQDMTFWNAVAV